MKQAIPQTPQEQRIVTFTREEIIRLGELHSNVELGMLLRLREQGIPVNREQFDDCGQLVASHGKLSWRPLDDGHLQFTWQA